MENDWVQPAPDFRIRSWKVNGLFKAFLPYYREYGRWEGFDRFIEDNSGEYAETLGFDVCWVVLFGEWEGNWFAVKPYRKSKTRKLISPHSEIEWEQKKAQYAYRCFYCGKITCRLTKDHIVPISKGGTDEIENIVPACRPCNRKKWTQPIEKFKNGAMVKMI